MRKLYCIEYKNKVQPYYGFIKPWNSVRDEETYSLTYLPPSFINGIESELGIKGNIVRHKFQFNKNGMSKDMKKCVVYLENGQRTHTIHFRNTLVNPIIILAFDNLEDAQYAIGQPLYVGQNIYPIYANKEFGIKEMTDDDFDNLLGVETIETNSDDENAIFVGFNRQKENQRMYININRNEW